MHEPSIMKKDTQQGSVRKKHILIYFLPVYFKLCVRSTNVFVQSVTFRQAVCLCSLYISQLLCSVIQFFQQVIF